MFNKKSLIIIVLALILLLSGFVTSDLAIASEDNTLVIAQENDPTFLDGIYWGNSHTYSLIVTLYDTLLEFDEGEIKPNLASDWEEVEENRWRFYLRDDVEFHNGEKFNAESVKFTIEEILDPVQETAQKDMLYPGVQEVEIIDDYTVDIITEGSFGLLLHILAHDVFMKPAEYYQELGHEEFNESPVGTGPYKFVSWDREEEIVLEAYDNYWKGTPEFDKVIYRPIPEEGTRISELRTGGVDIIANVSPALMDSIDMESGIKVEAVPSFRVMYYKLRYDESPTDSKEFRQAINYAVDRESISGELFGGYAEPISQATFEGFTGYNPDLDPYPYDPDKARELLEKAGYDGEEVGVEGPSDRFSLSNEILEITAAYLRDVGINAKVEALPWGTSIDRLANDETYQLYYNGHAAAQGDVEIILSRVVHSQVRWSYVDNPELDKIIEDLNKVVDLEERQELGAKAMELMHEDASWLFMFRQPFIVGVSDDIEISLNPFESISPRDVIRVNN